MFLGATGGYDRDGQQRARGNYLAVFHDHKTDQWRCAVRKITLNQFGHFMMGDVHFGDWRIAVSGGMGHDGLPRDKPHDDLWVRLHPIPPDVLKAFQRDGNWDESVLLKWAKANVDALKKLLPSARPKHKWVAPYRPILRAVPCFDSGGNWIGDVRNGSLIRYHTGHCVAFARVLCWTDYQGEDRLVVLEASDDFRHSYTRLAKPEDVVQVLGMGGVKRHMEWFFGSRDFGPEVSDACHYGALSDDHIAEHLDHKKELAFPPSKWRQYSADGSESCKVANYLLNVFDDDGGQLAIVSNHDGRKWDDECFKARMSDQPEPPKPEGAVYDEHRMPQGRNARAARAALKAWCVERTKQLQEESYERAREAVRRRREESSPGET